MRTCFAITFLGLLLVTAVTVMITAGQAEGAVYDGTKCVLRDGDGCGEPPGGSQPGACTTNAPCSGDCSYCLGSFDGPLRICIATKETSTPTTHCAILESPVSCGSKYTGATCRKYFGSEFCYCPPVGTLSGPCVFLQCEGDVP